MKIVNWTVEASCENFSVKGSLTVDNNATDEEIEEAVSQEVFNVVQWGWSVESSSPQESGRE